MRLSHQERLIEIMSWPELHRAAFMGYKLAVKRMLDNGADPSELTRSGKTILECVAESDDPNPDVVALLAPELPDCPATWLVGGAPWTEMRLA